MRWRWWLCLLLSVMAGCRQQLSPSNSLTVATDLSTISLGANLLNAYEVVAENTELSLSQSPRSQVLTSIKSGMVDAAFILLPPDDRSFFFTAVGQEQLVFIVNDASAIEEISLTSIRALYTGQVIDWNGPYLPPTPLSLFTGTSLVEAFEQTTLDGNAVGGHVMLAESESGIVAQVADSDNTIGFVSYSTVREGVTTLAVEGIKPTVSTSNYPVRATVVIVTASEPTGRTRDFVDWVISDEGQAVVRRQMLGFAD